MNISSIVVQCRSEYYDGLTERLEESGLCDFHFGDKEKGKIIITIEGEDVEEEIKKLTAIQAMPHVIAADMMQTYQEDMLDNEIKNLEEADLVPEMLNDDTLDAADIVYHGDLKKRF
jgi:nitrate reductase NapD